MTPDIQWKWTEIGAQTGRMDVLTDPKYTTTKPWNATFPESMKYVKDYWHLIEYPELLDIWQKYASLVVSGEMERQGSPGCSRCWNTRQSWIRSSNILTL